MSPLNKGPLLGPRLQPAGIRLPPPPRFGPRLPPPGMPPRMPPPPMNAVFGLMRQRLPPPPRPAGVARPGGPLFPPGGRGMTSLQFFPPGGRSMTPLPLFPPGGRGMTPLPLFPPGGRGMTPLPPMAGLRCPGPRGPLMRPWPRRILPPQILPHMRPRFSAGNGAVKGKVLNNAKKVIKLEELELKKPWMTDEIRSEIQKKNKLYAKAKKNKDAKEWEEFKDLRNKVTRMIRDAKNEYLAKHPEQGGQKTDDKSTNEFEGVQKTDNATEQSEQTEQMEETQPSSEQAHLYQDDEEPYDQRDENYDSSDDDKQYYCEVCDRDFPSEETLFQHLNTHKLCGIDGCTFSAHPLLVEKHISMQHSTGLYQRMKNLSTPEDIQKWIEERKRKYPTKANIEAQKAAELEKIQRGEIIKQEQRPARATTNKTFSHREKKRKIRRRQPKRNQNTSPVIEVYRGLVPFPGLSCLQNEDSNENCNEEHLKTKYTPDNCTETTFNISDEEDVSNGNNPITNTQTFSLVANYESDSENDESPDEVPIKKIKTCIDQNEVTEEKVSNPAQDVTNNISSHIKNVSCNASSDTASYDVVSNTSKKLNGVVKKLETHPKNNNIVKKRYNKNRLHLLQRLLSKSIKHERNVICQCIKYIVDNNFFD